MSGLANLRGRLAELADLAALEMLAHWDQLVMMPTAGGAARAQALGTLARLAHERATAEEIGGGGGGGEGAPLRASRAGGRRGARRALGAAAQPPAAPG